MGLTSGILYRTAYKNKSFKMHTLTLLNISTVEVFVPKLGLEWARQKLLQYSWKCQQIDYIRCFLLSEYPDVIPQDNERVSKNHNILDETDHSFLTHIWSKHQTVHSVLEKHFWIYAERTISINKKLKKKIRKDLFSTWQMKKNIHQIFEVKIQREKWTQLTVISTECPIGDGSFAHRTLDAR